MSETSINISSGAKTRLANIISGLFIILLVLLFGGFLELVPMPAIAALLIVAGFESIKMGDIEDVRDTGPGPRLIMIITFAATLFLPIQEAVLAGVVLSLLHFIYRSSNDVHVLAIKRRPDGALEKVQAPEKLPSDKVTALSLYGSMFFASAYLLEETLPSPAGVKQAVAVLHLRGLEVVGSTFIKVIERYAERLQEAGGTLFLAGVTQQVYEQLEKTETTHTIRPEYIFIDSDILGHSMLLAIDAAEAWLASDRSIDEDSEPLDKSQKDQEG